MSGSVIGDPIVRKAGHTRAVYAFGRFQPPTIGHGLLYDSVLAAAGADGDAYVFPSNTSGDAENPLTIEQKITYLKKMHAGKNIAFVNTSPAACACPTFYIAAEKLLDAGYTDILFLCGSDRVARFSAALKPLPERRVADGKAAVAPVVTVAMAGAVRKPGGISGTAVRAAAIKGDVETFKAGIVIGAMTEADIKDLMNIIRRVSGKPALAGGKRTAKRRTMKRRA
jgi:hypothetical protein